MGGCLRCNIEYAFSIVNDIFEEIYEYICAAICYFSYFYQLHIFGAGIQTQLVEISPYS